jgi:hypothetical protein
MPPSLDQVWVALAALLHLATIQTGVLHQSP